MKQVHSAVAVRDVGQGKPPEVMAQTSDTSNLKCALVALLVLNIVTIVALIVVAVSMTKVGDDSIDSTELGPNAVSSVGIQDAAVTAGKLAAEAVTRDALLPTAVGGGLKLAADGSVTLDTQAGVAAAGKPLVLGAGKSVDTLTVTALKFGSDAAALPEDAGTSGQVLQSDGSGNLLWTTSTGPTGPTGTRGPTGPAGATVRHRWL